MTDLVWDAHEGDEASNWSPGDRVIIEHYSTSVMGPVRSYLISGLKSSGAWLSLLTLVPYTSRFDRTEDRPQLKLARPTSHHLSSSTLFVPSGAGRNSVAILKAK